jgi:hypothetical protein
MSSFQSFPPHQSRPSEPLTPALALAHLSNYLAASLQQPCLLPNATLQTTGPVAKSDASSNLVIHNLKRVEAGLRGEWLAPSLSMMGEETEAGVETSGTANKKIKFTDDAEATTEVDATMGTEGWQDLDEYQHAQTEEFGELGPRDNAIGEGEGAQGLTLAVKPTAEGKEGLSKKDKEARKKEKKEREKAAKREKAEKARKAAETAA